MDAYQAVIEVVNGVAIHADLRQWGPLRALYADRVAIDYTSLVGGEPAVVSADDLIAGWQTGLSRYRATQHLLGSHHIRIADSTAQALVYVQATHWLPQPERGATWSVHGHYDYTLEQAEGQWRITRHVFTAAIVYGSRALLEMQGVKAEWLSAATTA